MATVHLKMEIVFRPFCTLIMVNIRNYYVLMLPVSAMALTRATKIARVAAVPSEKEFTVIKI